MMNVGENRAQNGVLDCPESKNEEKFLSDDRMGSSRYAMEKLSFLRDLFGTSSRYATGVALQQSDLLHQISCKMKFYFFYSLLLHFQAKNQLLPPSKHHFKPIRSQGSHQGSFLQVLIVVLTADIRQIR
ncbi:hypothetical protein E3N88_40219 [Mikania micrantha]|uniref:Uncharacterized protein n=1 Tax=Mikania micrantha TaxID=192012 RepID=A0A5N6LLZ6_9ASTR|nr:hypothetical protein E3N88_40219 [Mikania micrantha]